MRSSQARWPLLLLLALAAPAGARDEEKLLEVEQFRGITVTGTAIRGITGGGRPWVITRAEAELEANGRFQLEVVGLVFAPGVVVGGVPVGGTTGAVTHFAATLSCLDAAGNTVNVTTPGFPASTTGDGQIETTLELPPVCLAPAVLIRSFNPTTGTAGNWFAVSGF